MGGERRSVIVTLGCDRDVQLGRALVRAAAQALGAPLSVNNANRCLVGTSLNSLLYATVQMIRDLDLDRGSITGTQISAIAVVAMEASIATPYDLGPDWEFPIRVAEGYIKSITLPDVYSRDRTRIAADLGIELRSFTGDGDA